MSGQQIAEVEGWERDLCVSETELVEKFVHMLQRREADLKMLGASSVEQLFSGHNKKTYITNTSSTRTRRGGSCLKDI